MVREALVKFTKEVTASLIVQSVSAGAIRISGETYTHAIAVTPDRVLSRWEAKPVAELVAADFEPLLAAQPEIVLLGTGTRQHFPPRELTFAFARRGIGLETMHTAAAARTFNVLASEGRRVTAVLYPAG